MTPLEPIGLEEIRAAARRIRGSAVRTPTLRLNVDGDTRVEIHAKLENLQPIGSFKIRGAANAMLLAPKTSLARGVYTASAGNMAQGVAWMARKLGVPCTVIVPDHAPQAKLSAISRLGGRIEKLPFDEWWQVLVDHGAPGHDGVFVHPVSDPAVIAGNATIGLEILEDVPGADTILVPYGGGGLSCGIASAVRALEPNTRVFGCEVETAAPLSASLAAGSPRDIAYTASFVDGIGARGVLSEMWPLVRSLLAGSFVSSVAEIAAAVRLLVERNRVVAEGAAGAAVAAALSGKAPGTRIVCVVSGGNIDASNLVKILNGEVP
ncbi:MAG: threonine ammonia-lyase [Thermoanaerobaculia bacterium]